MKNKNMEQYVDYILDVTTRLLAIDSPTGYTKDAALFVMEEYRRLGYEPKMTVKIIDSYRCESILYISCKPTSLARDILVFMNAGYKVKKIQCVDMFPNTVHVETVCLLSLK